jgi:hypothetical protein
MVAERCEATLLYLFTYLGREWLPLYGRGERGGAYSAERSGKALLIVCWPIAHSIVISTITRIVNYRVTTKCICHTSMRIVATINRKGGKRVIEGNGFITDNRGPFAKSGRAAFTSSWLRSSTFSWL